MLTAANSFAIDLKKRVEHYPTIESDLNVGAHDAIKCSVAQKNAISLLDFVICIDDKESDSHKYNYFSVYYLIGLFEEAHKKYIITKKYAHESDVRASSGADMRWKVNLLSTLKEAGLSSVDYCIAIEADDIEKCKKDEYYLFN